MNDLDKVVQYIGLDATSGKVGADHIRKFIWFAREHSGKMSWDHMKRRLRLPLNMQFRYLEELKEGLLAWGVIQIGDDETVVYIGIPKDKAQLGRPFKDYEPPPERK